MSSEIEQNFGIASPGPEGSEGVGDFSKSEKRVVGSVCGTAEGDYLIK